jgi:signal transduction histidine kinase
LRVATAGNEADEIYMTVEDTGREVSREQLAGLFDALVASGSKGTGLGLAFSQMIVQRHGGQIDAHNRSCARGTLLRVTLPRGNAASDSLTSLEGDAIGSRGTIEVGSVGRARVGRVVV